MFYFIVIFMIMNFVFINTVSFNIINYLELTIIYFIYYQIATVIIYKSFYSKDRMYFLKGYFWIFWFVYNGFGICRVAYLDEFGEKEVWISIFIVLISTLLILLGSVVLKKLKINKRKVIKKQKKINTLTSKSYNYLFVLCICIFIYMIYAAGGIKQYIQAPYLDKFGNGVIKNIIFILKNVFLSGFYFYSWAVIFEFKNIKKKISLKSILYIILYIIYMIIGGHSSAIIFSTLVPLYYLFIKYGRVDIGKKIFFKAIPIFTIFLFLAMLVRFNRDGTGISEIKLNIFYKLINSHTFDQLENLIRVIRFYGDDYSYGSQLIYPLFVFLPRAILPFKPVELGVQLVIDIYGIPESVGVAFAPSIMGELFFDFGYLGIIIGMFTLGIVIEIMENKYYSIDKDNIYNTFKYINLSYLMPNIIFWYTGWMTRIIYCLLFWYIVSKIKFKIKWR